MTIYLLVFIIIELYFMKFVITVSIELLLGCKIHINGKLAYYLVHPDKMMMLWHNSIFMSVQTIVDILLTIVTFFCVFT